MKTSTTRETTGVTVREELSETRIVNTGAQATGSAINIRPSAREAFLLDTFWKWHEASADSGIVLGQPLSS